ncbi:MAG: toxin-antitoxin system YwqK family antitoxin [Flavobacteriaceae bacterium]
MKAITILMAMAFGLGMYAQDMEPKFEEMGDKVRATYFHDNGTISQMGYFKDGKLHGDWVMFNEQAEKIAMGTYVAGKKTGKWFFWEGDTVKEVNYEDNRVASVVNSKKANPVVTN